MIANQTEISILKKKTRLIFVLRVSDTTQGLVIPFSEAYSKSKNLWTVFLVDSILFVKIENVTMFSENQLEGFFFLQILSSPPLKKTKFGSNSYPTTSKKNKLSKSKVFNHCH